MSSESFNTNISPEPDPGKQTEKSDEDLIESLKKGSEESLKILYERYRKRIYNYMCRLTYDREAARDYTHEVFIHLQERAKSYRPIAKFSTWLYTIARNLAFDAIKKRKRTVSKNISLDTTFVTPDQNVTLAEMIASPDPGVASETSKKEFVLIVKQAIAKLSPSDREIIQLCCLQELPHRDVAEILGYKENTLNVKLKRARERLVKILGLNEVTFQEILENL